MNLLYLTLLIPLLSFLFLICAGRYIKIENIIVTGVSTVGLLCLIMIFICVDYQTNIVPDTSLIYYRQLWDWITIGRIHIPVLLYLDGLSLVFLVLLCFFSLIIYIFAACYLKDRNEIYTFFAYGNLLIVSLFVLILANNLFIFLMGWEGVNLSVYLLIGIYYKNFRTGLAAVKTFIVMHIADLFLLTGFFLIYNELNAINIRDILTLANENLATDSSIVLSVVLLIFIGVMGKTGLLPFYSWFAETSIVSAPIIALLQSLTAIFSGGYLILRLNNLFMLSTDIFTIIDIIVGVSIIFAGLVALVQNDIKRIVTYINLMQICYLFLAFVSKNWVLSLNYAVSYCVMSLLLLLSTSLLIQACHGERNIQRLGGLYRHFPVLYCCFLLSAASLSAMPWIVSTFYIKGDVIWGLMVDGKTAIGSVALLGILLSTLSILRVIFVVFHRQQKLTHFVPVNKFVYLPLAVLSLLSTAIFMHFPLPIQGIIPELTIETHNQLAFQLLLTAITILGILIAYILYAHSNTEIEEIVHTPIGRTLVRLWRNEWRFDKLLQLIFAQPYLYVTRLVKDDPLSKWVNVFTWGIRKINFRMALLENGRIRWYMVSVVAGAIMLLLLLVLI